MSSQRLRTHLCTYPDVVPSSFPVGCGVAVPSSQVLEIELRICVEGTGRLDVLSPQEVEQSDGNHEDHKSSSFQGRWGMQLGGSRGRCVDQFEDVFDACSSCQRHLAFADATRESTLVGMGIVADDLEVKKDMVDKFVWLWRRIMDPAYAVPTSIH